MNKMEKEVGLLQLAPKKVTPRVTGAFGFVTCLISCNQLILKELKWAVALWDMNMRLYEGWKEILKIQKFRRITGYTVFYCFSALISYAYTSNTTRAGFSRADQFYASYPAGTELLTDSAKLYKAALGNCFEEEEWGPIEWLVMVKHFERQGKSPYAYHAQYMAHLVSQGQIDGSG